MWRFIFVLSCIIFSQTSFAAVQDDIRLLLKNNKPGQAYDLALQAMRDKPNDPKIRFVYALTLIDLGRRDDAIKVYEQLIIDVPELQETYNNLAVLYAAQNRIEDAKRVLRKIIKIAPEYNTAKENLADLEKKYPTNSPESTRMGVPVPAVETNTSRPKPASTEQEHVQTNSVDKNIRPARTLDELEAQLRQVEKKNTPASHVAKSPLSREQLKSAGVTVPDNNKIAFKQKAAIERVIKEDVANSVFAWLAAWSSKDIEGYLAMYSSEFIPPNGKTREEWEDERKTRINRRGKIQVEAVDMMIEVASAAVVTVTFKQWYKSSSFTEESNKALVFIRENPNSDEWKIAEERTSY